MLHMRIHDVLHLSTLSDRLLRSLFVFIGLLSVKKIKRRFMRYPCCVYMSVISPYEVLNV
jgi:hypothetical protein